MAVQKNALHLDVVSAEGMIFSGEAQALFASGEMGELGILPGHTQLITRIMPGPLRVQLESGEEELLYVSGGVLEVQPHCVTVLADTTQRPEDMDEAEAMRAKEAAEKMLDSVEKGDVHRSREELMFAMAKLRVLHMMKKKGKK